MPQPAKYVVRLTPERRAELERITRCGADKARRIRRARVLLMCDRDHPLGRYSDGQIARTLGVHVNTVAKVRRAFVESAASDADRQVAAAIDRKRRLTPPTPPKLDGHAEATLVAICCSPPPDGRVRWTLRLLQAELVGRGIVASIGCEAIRKRLKKTRSRPGVSSGSASPSGTRPASSRRWKRCSTSTPGR
jgi:Homeodomain-like domain-containing protein